MSVLHPLFFRGPSRAFLPLWLAAVLLAAVRPTAAAPAAVRLRGHIPLAAVAHARRLGRVASAETIRLALALPLRDPAGRADLLTRLYDPSAPEYGQYLTPNEFARRFGPTPQDYDAVLAFARARGLTITGTPSNRLLVDVSGPASVVEAAFAVHLLRYRAADGHVFRAPDAEPAVPAALVGRLAGVIGLANTPARPYSHRLDSHRLDPRLAGNAAGSGPLGGLIPSDIKTAYNLNKVTQTGAGRTLALYELDGYTPDDITQYENAYSLPAVPLQNILINNTDGSAGSGAGEVTLDIELMAALAPGATTILVYEGTNGTSDQIDTYNRIATDNIAKEVSTSWGLTENDLPAADITAESHIFQQMAMQGQTLYAAAGDFGAYDDTQSRSVDDPASQPFVTGVGGTKLTVAAPGGAYQSESAWGDPSELEPDPIFGGYKNPLGAGGGGGFSDIWTLPNYQSGIAGASTTQRNVPDVSLDADSKTGYSIFFGGQFIVLGGTSCAAPLWAAFTALVNQARVGYKNAPLGFANPTLYTLGTGAGYAQGFHDVTSGTNLFYAAGTGYDNATGFGSFNGAGLLTLLAPPPAVSNNPLASLTLTPPAVVGGLPASGTVILTNPAPSGGATVSLSSSDTTGASVPASVTVTGGGTTATFAITTVAVTSLKTVTIMASYGTGTLTAALQVTPPLGSIAPMALAFTPDHVCGGVGATGTVTLNGPAPAGGLSVALTSGDVSASVPGSVTVAAGATTADFSVATSVVKADTDVTLTATANKVTQTGTLTVQAATLDPFQLDAASITGGRQIAAAVNLSCPAAPGVSTEVLLASDNPAVVAVPAFVTVPTGSTQGTFTVSTTAVTSAVTVNVTASYNGQTQHVPLEVQPGGLVGLTLAPTSLIGGGSATGSLTLDTPAPAGGVTVTLTGDTLGAAAVPASVVVPAGANTVSFPIATVGVPAVTVVPITATFNGTTLPATLTVLPVQVSGLTLNPARIILGGSSTGTVTTDSPAPAGGLSVALSSGSANAVVPAAVTIPAGATSATFPVTGAGIGTASLAAALGGQTQTAALTVLSAPGTAYPAGLNLMSVPYDYSGQALDGVFGYAGVRLAVWQPGAGAYALTPTAPADALRPGQGYWVNLPRALTLTSVGTAADRTTDFSIPLQAGWNQIGDPFPISISLSGLQALSGGASVPFGQAVVGPPLLLSALVYRYTPASGSASGAYAYVPAGGSLQPGQGYWLYAYQAVTLVVPHPAQ